MNVKPYVVEVGKEDAFCEHYGIGLHPGYEGMFTTHQEPGALPNGTRIVKRFDEPGDKHRVGDEGVVLGSIGMADEMVMVTKYGTVKYMFFVEWDDQPKVAVGIIDLKVREKV